MTELHVDEKPAYFLRTQPTDHQDGVRTSYFRSTPYSTGAWQDDELHMGSVAGLVAAELVAFEPRENFLTTRISYDILGKLHAGDQIVRTRCVRPGRTIELIEITVEAGGRSVLNARAWRTLSSDMSQAVRINDEPLPPLAECQEHDGGFAARWPGGFVHSLKARVAPDHTLGRGRVWVTTPVDTIAGEPTTDLVRVLTVLDVANGVAPAMEPFENRISFANVDLTAHFYREPQGAWLGLATHSSFGGTGGGITWSVLHDEQGPCGHAAQAQTVRWMDQ